MSGDVTAIRVPGYCAPDVASGIADRLLASPLHGRYVNAPAIGRVGQAYFESQADPSKARAYRDESVAWIRELRRALSPQMTPIDRFRLELDEVWGPGANLASQGGHKMFVGLARCFGEGSDAEPHQDILAWDVASTDGGETSVTRQIAMNVYLRTPDAGGELVLWSISYPADEYESRKRPGSYGLRPDALPEPAAILAPREGELILFDATRVHAVSAIRSGTRVTWSCFVGYSGSDRPLVLWS